MDFMCCFKQKWEKILYKYIKPGSGLRKQDI